MNHPFVVVVLALWPLASHPPQSGDTILVEHRGLNGRRIARLRDRNQDQRDYRSCFQDIRSMSISSFIAQSRRAA